MPEKIEQFLLKGLSRRKKSDKGKESKKKEPNKEAMPQAPDIIELKSEALSVLFGQYDQAKAQAVALKGKDIAKANELLDKAEELLARIEELHNNSRLLIDDLEKIIEQSGKKKREAKGEISEITASTPEGKEVRFELKEQLEYWDKFYKEHKIDWVKLPGEIKITEEQTKEIKNMIEKLGFDRMIIIPENLAAEGKSYAKLQQKMSEGYKETYQSDNFKADGGFAGLKNKDNSLRIIMTKEVQNLQDDELFKETLNKSVDELEAKGGIFEEKRVRGMDVATYLVYQREYYEKTNKHLDEVGGTWLTEAGRPASGRVPHGDWNPDHDRLDFYSSSPGSRSGYLGCRPAGS